MFPPESSSTNAWHSGSPVDGPVQSSGTQGGSPEATGSVEMKCRPYHLLLADPSANLGSHPPSAPIDFCTMETSKKDQGNFADSLSSHSVQQPSWELTTGFPYSSTMDMLGSQCCGGCPVRSRMFSNTPGLLDARSVPRCDNQKCLQVLPNVPGWGAGNEWRGRHFQNHCPQLEASQLLN